jgi:hypothetical protein
VTASTFSIGSRSDLRSASRSLWLKRTDVVTARERSGAGDGSRTHVSVARSRKG